MRSPFFFLFFHENASQVLSRIFNSFVSLLKNPTVILPSVPGLRDRHAPHG